MFEILKQLYEDNKITILHLEKAVLKGFITEVQKAIILAGI